MIRQSKKVLKIINKIFQKFNAPDIGVIISWLSYNFINICEITKEEFFESLKNSLEIIEKHMEDKNE